MVKKNKVAALFYLLSFLMLLLWLIVDTKDTEEGYSFKFISVDEVGVLNLANENNSDLTIYYLTKPTACGVCIFEITESSIIL